MTNRVKQAPLKSILVLSRVEAIADTFRTAITAADPRVDVIVYRGTSEFLADPRAPRRAEIAMILTTGDAIMIAAMSAALQRAGITRTLAVFIGDGPAPQGSTFVSLSPDVSFEAILLAIQNMLGLPRPTSAIDALSPMRKRILAYMADHLTDKEIGQRTGLKLASVSDNVSKILQAMGARNRAVAASIYRQHGQGPSTATKPKS